MTAEQIEREHRKDLERLKQFRLLDDDFMKKVFDGNPLYIQIVLRIVLNMPELTVIHVETEFFVENLLNRSVRLDVVATDGGGRTFNVEIQRADDGADPRRARYHSSMLDAFIVKKGTKFYDLPETWVIFITERDIFREGRPLYQIERTIRGGGIDFNDGAHILYVNGEYRADDDLGRLMHDFSCTNPDDMYDETLAERVRFFKESRKGVEIMCRVLEEMRDEYIQIGIQQGVKQGIQQGVQQGIQQGVQQGVKQGEKNGENRRSREVALRMLRAGKYAADEIAEVSGLSLDVVRELRA